MDSTEEDQRDALPVSHEGRSSTQSTAALSLLAREKLSGPPAPAAAQKVLSLWRDTVGEDVHKALEELSSARDDQATFTRAARKLLAVMELAERGVVNNSRKEIDRGVIHAMRTKDLDYLAALDPKRLQAGSSEIRSWIVTAAAAVFTVALVSSVAVLMYLA